MTHTSLPQVIFSTGNYRTVPCPWVDDFLGVVSWTPKGKKTVGQYIASWSAPEKKKGQHTKLSKHFSSQEQGKRQIKCLDLAQKKVFQMKIVSFQLMARFFVF